MYVLCNFLYNKIYYLLFFRCIIKKIDTNIYYINIFFIAQKRFCIA